jgi:hypothetical protein
MIDTLAPTTAPVLALATDSGAAADKITNVSTLNVSGLETGAAWQYSLDTGTSWINGSGTTVTGITGDGAKSVTVKQTDVAGNTSPASAAYNFTLDTTAPVFSSTGTAFTNGASAIATTTTVYDANATDNGGAADAGVTYSLAGIGADNSLFNISSLGLITFKTDTTYASPQDSGLNNIYNIGVRATDAAGNFSNKAVAIAVTDGSINIYDSATVRDATTSLGKLIAGVTVDGGSTFYHWDRSGDGTSANTASALTGNSVSSDQILHDVLDDLFNKDINGDTNTTVTNADGNKGTTDTYHYATFYDATGAAIKVSLPTINGAEIPPQGINSNQNGTIVGNSTASLGSNEANATFSDLLAIWDAYNGTGTGSNISGVPPGWQSEMYWSATPSDAGHIRFISSGAGYDTYDANSYYVALQVL